VPQRIARRLALLLVSSALLLPGLAPQAQALSLHGHCTKSGYNAGFTTYYRESHSYNYIGLFTWDLRTTKHKLNNKSNIEIKQKWDKRFAKDPTVFHWKSGDNVHRGAGSHRPRHEIRIGIEHSTYSWYKAIFDRPHAKDPRCSTNTTRT